MKARGSRLVCPSCGVGEVTDPKSNLLCPGCMLRVAQQCPGCSRNVDDLDDSHIAYQWGRVWHADCLYALHPPAAKDTMTGSALEATASALDANASLAGAAPYAHMRGALYSAPVVNAWAALAVLRAQEALRCDFLGTASVLDEYEEQYAASDGALLPPDAPRAPAVFPKQPATRMPVPSSIGLYPHHAHAHPAAAAKYAGDDGHAAQSNERFVAQSPPPPRALRSTTLEGVLRRLQAVGLARDRVQRYKTIRGAVVAREVVDYLLCSRQCPSRAAAVVVGQALVSAGMLAHWSGAVDAAFEDRDTLWTVQVVRRCWED
jgi:hypothetical protein